MRSGNVLAASWTSSRTLVLAAVLLATSLGGCNNSKSANSNNPKQEPPQNPRARAVFNHLLKTYQRADSYSDNGTIGIRFWQEGQLQEGSFPLAVTFQRPNKIAANLYQVKMASDGSKFRARIEDEQTNDVDRQVVVLKAPEKLTLKNLYQDGEISGIVKDGIGRFPVQIELLLAPYPLSKLAAEESQMRLLEEQAIDRRPCYRLEVKPNRDSQSVYILWIDRDSYVLRRFEYPADYIPELDEDDDVKDLQIVAEFKNASFEVNPSDEAFQFDVPEDANIVKYIIVPPQPLSSDLFGKSPENFFFSELKSGKATRDAMLGRTTILLWFNIHSLGQASLQQLDAVRKKYQDNDKVAFYAVCTDPSSITDAQVGKMVEQLGVETKVLRDLQPFGRDTFNIAELPTLVILDEKGVLQLFEVLHAPLQDSRLSEIIDRLLSGESLAAKTLADHKAKLDNYARQLTAARDDESVTVIEQIPETKIAEPKLPEKLKLTRLWNCDELAAPGSIFVIDSSRDKPTILVHDGGRIIVELDEHGKVAQRHKLDLPADAVVSFLRSTVDGNGRRYYVLGQPLGHQVHLFDEQWKHLLSYPDAEQQHPGISDVQIADLDGDEEATPELYIGFSSLVGIHRVSLQGRRQWSNRTLSTVLSLAISTADKDGKRSLLAAGYDGRITSLNAKGKVEKSTPVSGRIIIQLFAAGNDNSLSEPYCGIASTDKGKLTAIGLNDNMKEIWAYKLPPAGFGSQGHQVINGRLLDASAANWLISGADGSINIVGTSKDDSDYYRYGEALRGLAITRFGDDRVLLAATEKGVTAWKVEAKKEAEQP